MKFVSIAFLSIFLVCAPSLAQESAPPVPDVSVVVPPADAVAGESATASPDVAVDTPPAEQKPVAVEPPKPDLPPTSNPDNVFSPVTGIEKAISEQLMYLNPQVNVNKIPSLFYSRWEHDLIVDARLGKVSSGPVPIPVDIASSGIVEISLGGIVYRSGNDWTIWLNNARVTPTALPAEIMDIKVYKEYIEFEWFDRSKNLIFPIRLRAHQRFNLDTRMFLPG